MGITRQFLSLEHVDAEAVQGLELKDLKVLATGRRARKLRVGELAGNRFDLTLREFPPGRHEDLERALSQLTSKGLPNFYGPQRFGAEGVTLRLGELLVRGEWRGYLRAYVRSLHGLREVPESSPVARLLRALDSDQRADWRAARSLAADLPAPLVPLAKQMARRPLDLASLVRTLPRRTKALHVSALQAAVFNSVLSQRMAQPGGPGRVLPGDLLIDPWTGAGEPAPEGDAAAEAQVQADLLRRVPSGPLPGPAALRTRGAVEEWERHASQQSGLDPETLASLPGALAPKGARRALLVGPRDVTWEADGTRVRLRFILPPGSYATVLLEELGKSATLSH
jgi:tRNA pseudouridine13 synthase